MRSNPVPAAVRKTWPARRFRGRQLTQEYETRIRDEKFAGYRLQDERRSEALARREQLVEEARRFMIRVASCPRTRPTTWR